MVRTLLLLIMLTGAVIVGLLAMHSLNTHATAESGHHATMDTDAADTSVTGDFYSSPMAAAEECADCGTNQSGMLAMACVLALLATVLLLTHPRGSAHHWLTLLPRPGPRVLPQPDDPGLPPPSLTVFCISRT
jgi:hypothetical protein